VTDDSNLREQVRDRYAAAARAATGDSTRGCGTTRRTHGRRSEGCCRVRTNEPEPNGTLLFEQAAGAGCC
jgi:hypothetical protein